MSVRQENRRLSTRLAIVAVAMFGFGFALVPFYQQICAALGVNSLEKPQEVTGQAVPSYGPQHAGEYFKKIECFCFTQQTLAAGESRRMPVTFVVDPRLPASVKTIALSYTFFAVPGKS
jgi:cytochrome c oxidase assembly protein Cox11